MNKIIYRTGTNVIKEGPEYTAKYVPLQVISSSDYTNEWKMKKAKSILRYTTGLTR